MPVPRRGIKQKENYRLIDDYSAFHINALVTTLDKLDLLGVDEITGLIKAWRMMATTTLLHEDWNEEDASKLAGSTLDLIAACKNFVAVPAHRCYAVCLIWNPKARCVEKRIAYTSGFGAVANVYISNRVFRVVHELMLKLVWLPCGNFFDDYRSGTRGHSKAWFEDGP